MRITLLCNAGLLIENGDCALLVDVPSGVCPPFHRMEDEVWEKILRKDPPFDKICGIYYTHDHPDHLDRERLNAFLESNGCVPVFVPGDGIVPGELMMGPFRIMYYPVDHAPIQNPLPHVVTLIETDGGSVYLPADSVLSSDAHLNFLSNRKTDVAIWNSMFLSRTETRALMKRVANRNYIYHMPADRNDPYGIWKKCILNYERYGTELQDVKLLDLYDQILI